MSRLRLKGPYHHSSPVPHSVTLPCPHFPPCPPYNWVSLPLGCPPLWRSPLCSRHETHSGCSVCEAELTEYPRSPDNPLVLKAHHQLMYQLHKHSDGLLTFSYTVERGILLISESAPTGNIYIVLCFTLLCDSFVIPVSWLL